MKTRFRNYRTVILSVILGSCCGQLSAQDKFTPIGADESIEQTGTNSEGKLRAGDYTRTLWGGDLERRYRIYIPKKYDSTKATPVVVVYHGGGGNPESMIWLKQDSKQ